jgi:uncharacterized membrane protein YfhO
MILLVAVLVWLIALGVALMRRRTSDAWRDLVSIGILGLATAGFFWQLLFAGMWMPAGGGDLAQFLYPTYKFAAEWWRRGVIPLWNPYLFSGMPFVGDIQSGIFYPLNLLTFFISSPLTLRDMEFLSVLHFFIAGAGMYLFLRFGKLRFETRDSRLGFPNVYSSISILASLAGAIAFEFSDLFITHFGNLNLIAVIAWMPLVLLFYRRAQTDGRPGFAAVSGVFLGIAFLAGHIQSFLFILIALFLLAIGMMIENRIRPADSMHYIGGLVIAGVISFGIAAPSLLPSIEMTQNTLRTAYKYIDAAQYSLPPAELIGLFVPGFFGRGPQDAWGPWSRVEVGYIGVLPILLAFLAIVLRRDRVTRFFGAFAIIGLALALGGYAILHGWLFQFAPVFGQLRAPARFIVLLDFGLAVLAALGFDSLLHSLPRVSEIIFKRIVRIAPWVSLLIALAAGSTAYAILALGQGQDAVLFARISNAANALAFFILLFALALALIIARATRFFRPRVWAVLALALIFFDVLSLGAYVDVSPNDPGIIYHHNDSMAFMLADGGLVRIDARGTSVDSIFPADTPILYGMFSVDGDNPLVLADYDRYWQNLGSRSSRLYDLLNVKYLIARKNVPVDREKFQPVFDEQAINIYGNMRMIPRAFVVFDTQIVADKNAAFDAIHAPDFEPTKTVVLERKVDSQPSTVNSGQASVNIVGYGPNEILIDTNTSNDGVLVLSEVYYPGWRAWVDDKEVFVLRADFLFRAVQLSTGSHRVRLVYDPILFNIGAGLFALVATGLITLSLKSWKSKRQVA